MKTFRITYPLTIKRKNKDSQDVNIYNYRVIFFEGQTNINSLVTDKTSSTVFTISEKVLLQSMTVKEDEMFLTDKDVIIQNGTSVVVNGEMRII